MSYEQIFILCLLAVTLALFVWGRIRYDVVAVAALLAAVVGGIVPGDRAFLGFGHPAVITVAAVLIISQTLITTGAIEFLARFVIPDTRSTTYLVASLCVVGALLSGFMNNVGALALLMPLAIQTAHRDGISPGAILMPLAFATILGGLLTLIGTPPNIIIAEARATASGKPFAMFDFLPVGALVAIAGVAFVAVIGWRLIPSRRRRNRSQEEVFDIDEYVAEFRIPAESEYIGLAFRDLEETVTEEIDVAIVGMIRADDKISLLPHRHIKADDILIIQADPETLARAPSALGLDLIAGGRDISEDLHSEEIALQEAVITPGSRLHGETLGGFRLRARYRINVMAVSREGTPHRGRLKNFMARAGDVLLLQGDRDRLPQVMRSLGLLPLATREIRMPNPRRAVLSLLMFFVAILVTSFGLLDVPVSFSLVALGMVLIRALPSQDLYSSIDWPVIVLLGALIPIGAALDSTGATTLIASWIQASAGNNPLLALIVLMTVTLVLSAIINNAATAVVMAPIAINIAKTTGSSTDGFLMGVAVAASCAFLTPIGHQNNTLVMGPGGYHFDDYWRMGMPLSILVLAIAIPAIAVFWGI